MGTTYHSANGDLSIVDGFKNPLIDAVLKSVLHGTNLIDEIIYAYTNNFKTQMDKYFNQGSDTDEYILGLPNVVSTASPPLEDKLYPFAPVVASYRDLYKEVDEDSTILATDSIDLLNVIGLGSQSLNESLRNTITDNIWAANITFNVQPTEDSSNESLRYCFEYYNDKYLTYNQTPAEYLELDDGSGGASTRGIQDPFDEWYEDIYYGNRLIISYEEFYIDPDVQIKYPGMDKKMYIGYGSIVRNSYSGSIGKIDTATFSSNDQIIGYLSGNTFITIEDYNNLSDKTGYVSVEGEVHVYRLQVSIDTYIELNILNPRTGHYIVRATQQDVAAEYPLVPIDRNLLIDKFNSLDASAVLLDGMLLHVEIIDKQNVKFYEKESFGNFLQMVNIIIIIGSLGSLKWTEVFTQAYLKQVTITLAINVAISEAVKLIAKHFGVLAAIVAAVAAYAFAIDKGYFKGSDVKGLPWAGEILLATTAVTAAVNDINKDRIKKLEDEYAEFDEQKAEREEEFSVAEELLGKNGDLDTAFTILTGTTRLSTVDLSYHEEPEEFFERTIHRGNPGMLAIVAIEMYVDGALRLPESMELINYSGIDQQLNNANAGLKPDYF